MQGIKISNSEYRKRDGVSSSDLKKMIKSPAHYKYWKDHADEVSTPALLMGRAAHKYMLEQDEFFDEFAIAPLCDRRTKEGKETYARFLEESIGKDVISNEDFEVIMDMHKALYETPFVEKLLSGKKELSFFIDDFETGLTLKARPDCITEIGGQHLLIDYKTTTDAENMRFYRDSVKLNYDVQMAYYLDILREATGKDYTVIIIAQEKTAPYCVNVFELSDQYISGGREVYREMLNLYKQCSDSGVWHGYMKNNVNILGQPTDESEE